MTIRYTCTGCESVLKIKDDKAGTRAKCPKCKLEFVVPEPDAMPEPDMLPEPELEESETPDPPAADSMEDVPEIPPPVKEPKKKTAVPTAAAGDDDDFDPLSVLTAGPTTAPGRTSPSSPSDRKVSVADMMRDFDTGKRAAPERKSVPEVNRVGSNTAAETSGSAADALSRAYQQKRAAATAPAPMSAKEVKKAEERALLIGFIRTRALPGIVLVVGLLYGYYYWMMGETYIGPDLFDVTGQVVRGNTPVPGMRVTFEPVISSPEDARGAAWGKTDDKGNFTLMYRDGWYGAPVGQYRVGLASDKGEPVPMEDELVFNVNNNGSNNFKIEL